MMWPLTWILQLSRETVRSREKEELTGSREW